MHSVFILGVTALILAHGILYLGDGANPSQPPSVGLVGAVAGSGWASHLGPAESISQGHYRVKTGALAGLGQSR